MTIPQTEPGEIETETEIVQNIEAEDPVQETKANEPFQDIAPKEPAKEDSLQLRVAEAYHKDAGKGVARIGVGALTSLGLENGGVVEIKQIASVAAEAYAEDLLESEILSALLCGNSIASDLAMKLEVPEIVVVDRLQKLEERGALHLIDQEWSL